MQPGATAGRSARRPPEPRHRGVGRWRRAHRRVDNRLSGRRDHYTTLGVPPTATTGQIRAAFRRLARASHPDANRHDPAAERRFKRVAAAYDVLGDPAARRAYDRRMARGRFAAPGGAGQASFHVDRGPIYHSDLGHHSDFYQAGDPLSVAEAAALVRRDPAWLRRAIRDGRLAAARGPSGYLLRRREVERLDRSAARRPRRVTMTQKETNVTDPNRDDEIIGLDGTPADEATRAEAPGWRDDPGEALDETKADLEVDAGSPQDVGSPNEGVVRE